MNAPLRPAATTDSQEGETAFLHRLGERVRRLREGASLTRKTLAETSGVSERYLAQLESGNGNISVLLLRKVSRAMAVPMDALLREEEERPARSGRVALVGLRGAGKSSLGRKLAEALHAPFVELDQEVEKEAGQKLGEVFAMYGQEAFRRFERRALERVLREHPRAVIAAGGSLVTDPATYKLLREQCVCVWLKASPDEHMSRVIAQGDMRPFKGRSTALEEIKTILREREQMYGRADVTIDTSGKSLKQTFEQLKRATA